MNKLQTALASAAAMVCISTAAQAQNDEKPWLNDLQTMENLAVRMGTCSARAMYLTQKSILEHRIELARNRDQESPENMLQALNQIKNKFNQKMVECAAISTVTTLDQVPEFGTDEYDDYLKNNLNMYVVDNAFSGSMLGYRRDLDSLEFRLSHLERNLSQD